MSPGWAPCSIRVGCSQCPGSVSEVGPSVPGWAPGSVGVGCSQCPGSVSEVGPSVPGLGTMLGAPSGIGVKVHYDVILTPILPQSSLDVTTPFTT